MRDALTVLAGFLAGTLAIVAIVLTLATVSRWHNDTPDTPYCPTEDSCTVEYSDGQWTIHEVTP